MKRRILSLLLLFSMVLTLLPVQAFAVDTANPFRDVREGDWYYDDVQYVRVNGFFNGTSRTTFSPNDTMTRGMFVTVLGRITGVDAEQYQGRSDFSDVPENAYFAPYVAWAAKHGITAGTGDGKFSPYAYINRQQMAAFFVRYFDAFGVSYDTGANITTTPADIDSVSPYARDAVLKLWRQGLLSGDGVNFNPDSSATRAQAAALCCRMDQVVKTWYKEPGVPSDRVKIDPSTGGSSGGNSGGGSGSSGGNHGGSSGGNHGGSSGGNSGGSSGGNPGSNPSENPGSNPSENPGSNPSENPGSNPSENPGSNPSENPGSNPSENPGSNPSENPGSNPSENPGENPGGDTETTFYEVQFQAGSGQGAMELPATKTYAAGTRIDRLPTPFGVDRVFLGWYYDEALTQPAAASDTLDRNVTLYAKMTDLEGGRLPQIETPNYVTAADVSPDFTLKLALDGAYQNGDLTVIDVTAHNEAADFSVSGDGAVTVTGGWISGHTYKAVLTEDSTAVFEYQGTPQPVSVRVFNIIVYKEEVDNLKLDGGIKFIPKDDVSDMSTDLDGLFQLALTQNSKGETQAVTPVRERGSFTYSGGVLENGDVVAIYEGVRPDRRTLETNNNGTVAYVEITGSTGNTYTYKTAETEDVLFTPDVLPVSASRKTGNAITLSRNEFADSRYAEMGLDANTTVDVGDYIAFYSGDWNSGASEVTSYEKITSVTESGGQYNVTYEPATVADVMASMDLYTTREQDIQLTQEQMQNIENSVMEQVEASGFLDEAAEYLIDLALETDGFRELAGDFELKSYTAAFSDGTPARLSRSSVQRAKGATIKDKSVTPKIIVGKMDHFEDSRGIRIELEMKLVVEVGKVEIELTAVFEQEVILSLNTSGGAVWKWAWIIPYIADYRLNANFDVGTYTGIGVTATAKTPGEEDEKFDWKPATGNKAEAKIINIGQQITDLMKEKDKFMSYNLLDQGDGDDDDDDDDGGVPISGGLTEKYAAMIEDADTSWFELFRQEIFSKEGAIDRLHILCYGISLDFVVSANLYVTLGVTFEYGVAKRYNFSVTVFDKKVTNETIDLETAHYQLSAYVMGTMGIRAGLEFEIGVGLFSLKLDSVGICAEAGVYAQLWGYFYYELKWEKGQGKSSYYAGATVIELGAYLEISFKAQLFSSKKLTYQPTLYENQWPFLTIGEVENVFDFIDLDEADLTYDILSVTRETLPSDVFTMKYMDMKTGKIGGEEDEDTGKMEPGRNCDDATESHFVIEFSDPLHFRYEPETNSIVVTPGTAVSLEGTMTIRWKNGTLALTSRPIERTLNITWQDPENARYYSFDSRGGSRVRTISKAAGEAFDWPKNPTKIGYDFGGWFTGEDLDESTRYTARPTVMPDHEAEIGEKGITLYAKWIPRDDTRYTVEHYCQSLNGVYELADTVTKIGTTDAPTAAETKTGGEYAHFTAKPFQQISIAPDGSAVVKIYYTRKTHEVRFTYGQWEDDDHQPMTYTMKYGATVYAPRMAVNGYNLVDFSGFQLDLQTGGTQVTKDAAYAAVWEVRGDTPYKVEHYLQKADGSGYELRDTEYKEGVSNATITAVPKTYEHFAVNNSADGAIPSGTVTTDGELVLKLYYDREKVTVTFDPDGGTMAQTTVQFLWGQTFQEPTPPTRDDYAFGGWYAEGGTAAFSGAVTEPITLIARWTAGGVNYTVEHYIMDTDGEYPAAASYTTTGSGTVGETVTLAELKNTAYETDGITFDGVKTGENGGSVVVSKGMTVELYYQRAQYTVTWNAGDGTLSGGAAETQTVYHGVSVTPPGATRTGFSLEGWYADSGFTGEKLGSSVTVTGSVTYYANWTERTSWVVYHDSLGNPIDETTDWILNIEDFFATPTTGGDPVKPELAEDEIPTYLFAGWCTDRNRPVETRITELPWRQPESPYNLYMVCLVEDSSAEGTYNINNADDLTMLYYLADEQIAESVYSYTNRLAVLNDLVHGKTGHNTIFKLTESLTLPDNWKPIGRYTNTTVTKGLDFYGDFDGNGKTIYFPGLDGTDTDVGNRNVSPIFGTICKSYSGDVSTVKNLTVVLEDEVTAVPFTYTDTIASKRITRITWGAIVGCSRNAAFQNCHVSGGTVTGSVEYFGGISGNGGTMENCTVGDSGDRPLKLINTRTGTTERISYTGGLGGTPSSSKYRGGGAYDCYVEIRSYDSSGGLAGCSNHIKVEESTSCTVHSNITALGCRQTTDSKVGVASGFGGAVGSLQEGYATASFNGDGTFIVETTIDCSLGGEYPAYVGGILGNGGCLDNSFSCKTLIVKNTTLTNDTTAPADWSSNNFSLPLTSILAGSSRGSNDSTLKVGANCTVNGASVTTYP